MSSALEYLLRLHLALADRKRLERWVLLPAAELSSTSVSPHLSLSVCFSVSPVSSSRPCHNPGMSLGWTRARQGAESV